MVSTSNSLLSEGKTAMAKKQTMNKRIMPAVLIAVAAMSIGIGAQSGRTDHWVGTWATAVVVRPQAPPAAVTRSRAGRLRVRARGIRARRPGAAVRAGLVADALD